LSIVSALSAVAAARMLGPIGRGELAAAQSIGGLIATFCSLGVGESLIYFVARRPEEAGQSLITCAVMVLAACLIVLPIGWFAISLLGLDSNAATASRAYLFVAFIFVLGLPGLMHRGLRNVRLWSVVRLVGPLAWLIAVLMAPIFGRSSVRIVVVFLVLQVPVLGAFWIGMVRRRQLAKPQVRLGGAPFLRYGFPLLLSSLPAMLSLRLDQMVLATQVSSEKLGIYACAAAWSVLALPLAQAVGNAVFPALAGAASGDRAFLNPLMRRTVLLGIVICAGAAAAGPVAIPILFGRRFREAGPVAAVLCVASIFLCVTAVSGETLRGLGRTKAVLRSELAGCAASVVSLAVLLPLAGLVGAALASCIGYAVTALVLMRAVADAQGQRVMEIFLPVRNDVAFMANKGVALVTSQVRRLAR
jgi:O-antigen/teichoic acid export membrane protein